MWRRFIATHRPHIDWLEMVGLGPVEVPFDQPLLAIMGMWRYGGGPNPHFALALGHLLRDVGQEHLAWVAFERARQMSGRFWKDEALVDELLIHLDTQQRLLETSIAERSGKTDKDLRSDFSTSLAEGLAWQESYQAYETTELAAGRPVSDPDFHRDFYDKNGAIASPLGRSELTRRTPRGMATEWAVALMISMSIFGMGLGCWLSAMMLPSRKALSPGDSD
jgi:hypothetical protein